MSKIKHATWQMTRGGPAKTGTYHCADKCKMAPVAAAWGNATKRSTEPTMVHAHVRPRADVHPWRKPVNANAASSAVTESPAAVATANSIGMPGERLGTRRPAP